MILGLWVGLALRASVFHRHAYHIAEVLIVGIAIVSQDVEDDLEHDHVAGLHLVSINLVGLELAADRHLDLQNPPLLQLAEQGIHLGEWLDETGATFGDAVEHLMGKAVAQLLGLDEDLDVGIVDGAAIAEPQERGDDVLAATVDARDGSWVVERDDMFAVVAAGFVVEVDDGIELLRPRDDGVLQQLIDGDEEGNHLNAVFQHVTVEHVLPLLIYFHCVFLYCAAAPLCQEHGSCHILQPLRQMWLTPLSGKTLWLKASMFFWSAGGEYHILFSLLKTR